MPKIVFSKNIADTVLVTEDHGTATSGKCLACGARGWLEGVGGGSRYGFPAHVAKAHPTRLVHAPHCPVNKWLNDDGSLRTQERLICCGDASGACNRPAE